MNASDTLLRICANLTLGTYPYQSTEKNRMENAVNKVRHTISRLKSRYLDERNIPPAAKEQTRLDRAAC